MTVPTDSKDPGGGAATDALELLDWRRRVFTLYREVRTLAVDDVPAAHGHWVDGRNDLLQHHPQSPVPVADRTAYPGAPVVPYDADLRFVVELDGDVDNVRFEFESATDGVVPFRRVGVLHVPEVGDLDVWALASYGGGLFVPVRDALAGRETYGGGRYLLDTVKGADLGGSEGELVIDFNFAYNPSCAYDPAWVCPLAPPGNVVRVPMRVGELHPADH
ncbi:MAG: hypothetical protein JWL73_3672 [Actinomycetia bacterium]|nr:hypothetical protein [Actinomycetes bacterium]